MKRPQNHEFRLLARGVDQHESPAAHNYYPARVAGDIRTIEARRAERQAALRQAAFGQQEGA